MGSSWTYKNLPSELFYSEFNKKGCWPFFVNSLGGAWCPAFSLLGNWERSGKGTGFKPLCPVASAFDPAPSGSNVFRREGDAWFRGSSSGFRFNLLCLGV
jgi:hypothetical protein